MTDKKRFSLLCPHCKDNIAFELSVEDLENSYSGETAKITLGSHGNPAHTVDVYIDRDGLVRSAFANFASVESKVSLQNTYITDATSDLNPQEGRAIGVKVVPYTVTIDDSPPKKYNEEIFFSEVYDGLKADKRVKSQPVSVELFLEAFKTSPRDKPIITLTVSQKYSEGYDNAIKAKKILAKEEPSFTRNIHIIDSKTTGPMMKLMINKALEMDEGGQNLDDIIEYLNWMREKHLTYIYVDSLSALRKSERVGRVTSFFGNLLGLKPVIIENENNNGELKPFKTVRSKKAAIQEIVKAIRKQFGYVELVGVIIYGIIIDDALEMQELLKKDSKTEDNDFTMDFIGTGVAMHLSYDVLGISLYPKL